MRARTTDQSSNDHPTSKHDPASGEDHPTSKHDPASGEDHPPTDRADGEASNGDLSMVARGRWGEDLAARHYQRLGYTVLDRNWRSATGELDLVVEGEGVVVFSEVKARRSDRHGVPAEAVGATKQRRLRLLALEWLRAHDRPHVALRFDVVSITGTDLVVYESAF